ncbi:glyoxylate/hydroxypyruvate reductase A [Paraburkholderia sp. BL18I3N2]|uniref:2-hydroxyacid dehydrogenase n=1 Tax=Paraburkholderia sp. BL18I3N2 TaxID=1938799 RepID=UPI000D072AA7|nr:glyoxylate/hydroxypyruvate reductase A [Paraburkholderia sp. BL18I3N2]PRX27306.1 glyoxylate/hydroxypyruvate reductase A [Paraburkholderia sp. BL18I3N2]
MRILFSMTGKDPAPWISAIRRALPGADVREWKEGDVDAADYALIWKPAPAVLRNRAGLKAIINMGAGVDWILELMASDPDVSGSDVPIYRIEDAGMASQMVEYATYATLRYFRRFDEYERQQREGIWRPLKVYATGDFTVGVLGLGSLGAAVAGELATFGFTVRGYSRSLKSISGVRCFSGSDSWESFLEGVHVLINLLPNTPQTSGVLNSRTFSRLERGACIVNLARGGHLVDEDLVAAIREGQIAGATLDVFKGEPLADDHPFWKESRITVTPHISAQTRMEESVDQVVAKIGEIELGRIPTGRADVSRGY